MNTTVFWKSLNVPVKRKMHHQKYSALYKRNKRTGIGFCLDEGDIPVANFNQITQKFEPIINTRGNAYACRNQLRYRKHKYV